MTFLKLFSLILITIFSGTTFVLFILWTDPERLSSFSFFLFYVSLLLFNFGFFSLFGIIIKRFLFKIFINKIVFIKTLRQGLLVGVFITLSLFLESINYFKLQTAIFLVIILGILEGVFNYYEGKNRKS